MLYNGCGFGRSTTETELLGPGAGLWEGLVDAGRGRGRGPALE